MDDGVTELSPKVARVATEEAFGNRLRRWIVSTETRFVDVARLIGINRVELYFCLDGARQFRAAWLELLPPAVERLYLEERAAHHGLELRAVGDENEHPRSFVDIVVEAGDVARIAAESERDGVINVDEARAELAAWRDLDKVRASRVALLERAVRERGVVLVKP